MPSSAPIFFQDVVAFQTLSAEESGESRRLPSDVNPLQTITCGGGLFLSTLSTTIHGLWSDHTMNGTAFRCLQITKKSIA